VKKFNTGSALTIKTPRSESKKIQDEFEAKIIIPNDFFWTEEEIENNE